MNLTAPPDTEITAEAIEVLFKHLPPSKVARALAAWKVGQGDYLTSREKLFAGESVDTLFKELQQKARKAA
jgi:hypothetical protein